MQGPPTGWTLQGTACFFDSNRCSARKEESYCLTTFTDAFDSRGWNSFEDYGKKIRFSLPGTPLIA